MRVEEIINKSKSKGRVESEVGEEFCSARGVRKRCTLKPNVFQYYNCKCGGDIEESAIGEYN